MKRNSILLLIVLSITFITGCSLPFLRESTPVQGQKIEIEPEFNVEQVVLSQGFQNTEPRIELSRKNNNLLLLVSPGIVQSTGMEVSKIEDVDGVYNIHLVNSSYSSAELVIPQITVLLSNVTPSEAESMKFSIVNENYTPVSVSHGIVDVLKKVKSDYKISTDGSPSIRLIKEENEPLWVIEYNNIYDTENLEIPLINLRLKVSANNGEVVESSKGLISTYFDQGTILDFVPGKAIIYSRKNLDTNKDELWYYDFISGDKVDIFKTFSLIKSAQLSPDGLNVALLERDGEKATAYTISIDDRRAVRIGTNMDLIPEQISWNNDLEIQVLTSFTDNQTQIFSYNIQDNSLMATYVFMMDLDTLSTMNDVILASEFTSNNSNNRILVSDGGNGFRYVDDGFSPKILNENLGMHLRNDDSSTKNRLHIFNLKTLETEYETRFNVVDTSIISDTEILVIEKLPGNNSFGAHILDIESFELISLGNINTSRIYLDMNTETIYANPSITYRSEVLEIIYSMNLSNLKSR
ncbi:hypothetical protein [Gudongella sp. DL1XJH-153]|uniref:hypothetical protein n=1 Tax=Gudongella sp. DL1XJH-153 TaxID=3409804 RepID=UPI003BB68457